MRRVLAVSAFASLSAMPAGAYEPENRWSMFGFAGQMTDNYWQEIFIDEIEWAPVYLYGIGISYEFARWGPHLAFEFEANLVQHSGEQESQELNLPIVMRWHTFPWDKHVDTSAAFGLGFSIATEPPEYEVLKEGLSQAIMVYWAFELEAGVPESDWSGFWRLHHRSIGFGAFGKGGGANSLVLGLRKRF